MIGRATIWHLVHIVCTWIVGVEIACSPLINGALLDYLGPSTEYYEPTVLGAERDPNGKLVAHLGDKVFISYIVVRHQINGTCLLHVWRYGEEIGGPRSGTRHLLDYADLQFVGANELRRPRWPIEGLVLGKDMNGQMLLADDVVEQEYALYNVAEYHCNVVDELMAALGRGRFLQGGIRANETERVNLTVRR
jgi:hypothetical protein